MVLTISHQPSAISKGAVMRNLQQFGVTLFILGLFFLAIVYFYDQIPPIQLNAATYEVMKPPAWSLLVTLGGGLAAMTISTIALAQEKANASKKKDE
jgi:hypothetical protein